MLPVNVSEEWYEEKGLQVLRELERALACHKRGVGIIITGIIAFISILVTVVTSATALTQTVQTAGFVDNVSKNISIALHTQESIDEKIQQKLDALYDIVVHLGNRVDGLHVSSSV